MRPSLSSEALFHFNALASTNTHLKQNIAAYPDTAIIWSDSQPGGRGRFERSWHSGAGKDLTFSVKVSLDRLAVEWWPCLTLATGVAVTQVLRDAGVSAQIKWPNDVLINNKKVCGILCETVIGGTSWVVVGVGINVNSTADDLADVGKPATTLFAETGRTFDRQELVLDLSTGILAQIEVLKTVGFPPIHARLLSYLAWRDRPVSFAETDGRIISGVIIGIESDGSLCIRHSDGTMIRMNAGELMWEGEGRSEK